MSLFFLFIFIPRMIHWYIEGWYGLFALFKKFIVWLFYFVYFWSFDLKLFFILLSCQKYMESTSLIKINWNFVEYWVEKWNHELQKLIIFEFTTSKIHITNSDICTQYVTTHKYNKYEVKSRFSDSLHFHTFSLMFYIFISHSIAFSSYLSKLMFDSKISIVVFSL